MIGIIRGGLSRLPSFPDNGYSRGSLSQTGPKTRDRDRESAG